MLLKRPTAVHFGVLGPEEIVKQSVCEINNERIYDEFTHQPAYGGVNDPRMGTVQRDRVCFTCRSGPEECSGHFGHINLAKPVFHCGMIEHLRKVLKCVCFNCSKVLLREPSQIEAIQKIKYPKQRFYRVLKNCEQYHNRVCQVGDGNEGCGMKQPKIMRKSLGILIEMLDEESVKVMNLSQKNASDRKFSLCPDEAYKILCKISTKDQLLMGIPNPSSLIIQVLAVGPPAMRPSIQMPGMCRSEDDLTYCYQAILKSNNFLMAQIEKGANATVINELRDILQYYVATLMDNDIAGQPSHKQKSGRPLKAIRSRLKGKEGRIRGNLMGKRVDFSARSVITPDAQLRLDQLGVPIKVAENITVPESVTYANIDDMKILVQNGPQKWPGALFIIRNDNKIIDLSMLVNRSDAHLEPGYKVERHLRDGDSVVFNRQPSLHKMSTMGHQVKVLPYSTFRLNLSVTSPYNADFDGDEMNMFVPQSYESLAEVKEIMAVQNQIISPQSNKPVMGLVQDSLLGSLLITQRDTFMDQETLMQIMMQLPDDIEIQVPTPAVLKPKKLWTGKQIMSMIIPEQINLIRYFEEPQYDKATGKMERNLCPEKDTMVRVQSGELLSGNFNKPIVGSAGGGMIHIIWKECGPKACSDFLSYSQLIINQWIIYHGHTVGVEDTITRSHTKVQIEQTIKKFQNRVKKIIQNAQIGQLKFQPGKNMIESFEAQVNTELNTARDQAGSLAFKDLDPKNKIQNMVHAGSKGTNINISQIMGCVGQQNVEGKRIPFGFESRSLPHFNKFDYGPASKGFVKNNYISGLDPSEFFFHAMGGREGLIDTAVKTAETGYIQRRLIKALEDVMVKYDSTVRNSADQIVQFLYGEDNIAGEQVEDLKIDTLKLSDQQLDSKYNFIPRRLQGVTKIQDLEADLNKYYQQSMVDNIISNTQLQAKIQLEFTEIMKDRDFIRTKIFSQSDEDKVHLPINVPRLILNCQKQFELRKNQKTELSPQYVIENVQKLFQDLSVFPGRQKIRFNKDQVGKELNENALELMKIYLRQQLNSAKIIKQDRFNQSSFDWLLGEIKSRFEQSLVSPGEMIGSIAAHSLGEPATQMTLNTFHFAGVSSKNVTLGVPRLKEVINVARNLKTPMLQIYLMEEYRKQQRAVMKVQGIIEHTTIDHILKDSGIFYDPDPQKTVIAEDQAIIDLYNEIMVPGDNKQVNSPWILRLTLDQTKLINKQIDIDFIDRKLSDSFSDMLQIMHSDANDDTQVVRLRFNDVSDNNVDDEGSDDEETAVQFVKKIEDVLRNELTLKGYPEIQKVYAKKYQEHSYQNPTKEYQVSDDNWMIETDGVGLARIFPVEMVEFRKTISNDVIEIKETLGIEAARQSLINEFRNVLNFYGIYVNYRHLSTLCDVMTQKGALTSITRHGINRLDTGPLRKCSFEETVEILLESALHSEEDQLKGVTENIMIGNLAPLGTGFFDVKIDPECIAQNVQSHCNFYEEFGMDGGNTPLAFDENDDMIGQTPMAAMTPYAKPSGGGATSQYGGGMTPAGQSEYQAGFSPGNNMYASPQYHSPQSYQSPHYVGKQSPGSHGSPDAYASPIYGGVRGAGKQSPIYNMYSSPIYQAPGMDGLRSPQSPIYQSPQRVGSGNASPTYSPSHPGAPYGIPGTVKNFQSPGYNIRNIIKQSPGYSPNIGPTPNSPNYSPMLGNAGGVSGIPGSGMPMSGQNSPAYSPSVRPTGMYSANSPNYSPQAGIGGTVKQNYSPSYTPANQNIYGPSPAVGPTPGSGISPKYSVGNQTKGYSPNTPCYNPIGGNPTPAADYCPQSPVYNPANKEIEVPPKK